ncbi:MAG: transposase [Saprospiraceae bacterium]|nr:transposase [Saprospiraceae bacterium]
MSNPNKSKFDYLAKFIPEAHYHVYNRTNNRELLFLDDADRKFFIEQYKRFVADCVDTYAYCLLPNHFHLVVRIKSAQALIDLTEQTPEPQRTAPQRQILSQHTDERYFHPLLERQFTRMFTSYATYFNYRYERSGNLFYRPFRRVAVDDDSHLHWLIYYIHHNPRKHKVMEEFLHYKWSSYTALISQSQTLLLRKAVWDIFGGKADFIAFHDGNEPAKPEGWNLDIEDE